MFITIFFRIFGVISNEITRRNKELLNKLFISRDLTNIADLFIASPLPDTRGFKVI